MALLRSLVFAWCLLYLLPCFADPVDREIRLAERWRLDEASGALFGVILDAIADDEGTVYLVDEQLAQIVVITPAGEVDRVLSRKGEGPGELDWPSDLLWLPDETLGVIDSRPGAITRLALDGTPAESFFLVGDDGTRLTTKRIVEVACSGDRWAMKILESDHSGGVSTNFVSLALVDRHGLILKRLHREARGWNFRRREYIEVREYLMGDGWWAMGGDGRIYMAPKRNEYLIEVYSPEGELLNTIACEFDPRRRSGDENALIAAGKKMTINGERVQLECDLEGTDPVIADLHVAADGRLWVLPCAVADEPLSPRPLLYEVYDEASRRIERVRFSGCDLEPQDKLIMLAPGRFIVLENADTTKALEVDEDAVLEVVLYEAG